MSKKKNKIQIEFIGNNATDVTGSATLISFGDRKILFECGGIQEGKTIYDNYKLNRKMLSKIKSKEIDMIIGGHFMHYDHGGNVCSIFRNNPNIRIITSANTKGILREMWLDSAGISERDCELLRRKYPNKIFEPYYYESDVMSALDNVEEYSEGEIHKLDENISIRYTSSGHIFQAMQCELFINYNNHVHKILFTSDLGNVKIQDMKPFVKKFEPVLKSNLVIAETTYGSKDNIKINQKIIDKDIQKIKTAIEQYCVEQNRRVLMPIFSLDKCPNVLWIIYQLFKDYPNFTTKIVVDSPLTNRLLDEYEKVLEGEAKDKFEEMLHWKNLIRIVDPNDSKNAMANMKNVCVLSSGGMLQSGRSVRWAESLLPHSNDCLILSGYCGVNTLGYKIKNYSSNKTININGKPVKNRCQIVILSSLSSHMQRDDLLKYYKSMYTEKICLVHGDMDGKIEFAEDLKKEICDMSKTTKVCVVNKGTKISL